MCTTGFSVEQHHNVCTLSTVITDLIMQTYTDLFHVIYIAWPTSIEICYIFILRNRYEPRNASALPGLEATPHVFI